MENMQTMHHPSPKQKAMWVLNKNPILLDSRMFDLHKIQYPFGVSSRIQSSWRITHANFNDPSLQRHVQEP